MHGPSTQRQTLLALVLSGTLVVFASACATVTQAAAGAADRATGREVAERVDRGVSAAADGAENAVLGSGNGSETQAEPPTTGSSSTHGSAASNQGPTTSGPAVVSTNFDFEPGDRVLFEDNFAGENMGDFPRSLDWRRGTLEMVQLDGQPFLRASSGNAALSIPLPEALPERFTIEVDIYNPAAPYGLLMTTGMIPEQRNGFRGEPHLQWAAPAYGGHGLIGSNGDYLVVERVVTDGSRGYENGPVRARVMVDAEHMKVFWGQERVANVPRVELPRGNAVHLVFSADPSQPIYIGNVRIAAGGRDLYAVLEREGRFTADGIEFDTGSDNIRPSSRPVLDEIGAMLQQHTALELIIEGHTDNEGSDASNQNLSERRAASVRTYLIENYGVGGERLKSKGYGESRPVASNDTREGRQENRRVDLVRAGAAQTTGTSRGSTATQASGATRASSATQTSSSTQASSATQASSQGANSNRTITNNDRPNRGTITITVDGRTHTFTADGTWGESPRMDDPNILAFMSHGGAGQESPSNPGIILSVTWDKRTGEVQPNYGSVTHNDLPGAVRHSYAAYVRGPTRPRFTLSESHETTNRRRQLRGTFVMETSDGKPISGTFDFELPAR